MGAEGERSGRNTHEQLNQTMSPSSEKLIIIEKEIRRLQFIDSTNKNCVYLPIYHDLQSVLQWRGNVISEPVCNQYKTELLMWYRKLMEHFYYTFLLRDLTEE